MATAIALGAWALLAPPPPPPPPPALVAMSFTWLVLLIVQMAFLICKLITAAICFFIVVRAIACGVEDVSSAYRSRVQARTEETTLRRIQEHIRRHDQDEADARFAHRVARVESRALFQRLFDVHDGDGDFLPPVGHAGDS